MVGMRKVRGPEEFVLTAKFDPRGQRMLVRIGGDPHVAIEVNAGLFLERDRTPRDAGIDRVHPVQPVAYPSSTNLEQDQLQAREFVEGAILHEAGQRMADRVGGG